MKAILISTSPEWVKLILNGIKKDEIRKGSSLYKAINKLIEEQGVAPALIYCTKGNNQFLVQEKQYKDYSKIEYELETTNEIKGVNANRILNGKVVARFNATADLLELKMIEGGLYFTTPDRDCFTPNLDLNENAQIDNWQLLRYTGEKLGTQISDIHINELEIFDKPKELWQFKTPKNAERYKRDLDKAYEDDYETGTRIAEGTANDDECANCVELTELSEGYYGLTRAPQSWCHVEL